MGTSREMLGTGARAPEVRLQEPGGKGRTLAEMLARGPVLLAFFKASCPVCQMTFPFLERLHQGAGSKPGALQIVGVSQNEAAVTRSFAGEFGITFPVLLDDPADYAASNAFGISSVPSLFLVEPDGTISTSVHGFSKQDLESVGRRMGVAPFEPGERVPEFRPG